MRVEEIKPGYDLDSIKSCERYIFNPDSTEHVILIPPRGCRKTELQKAMNEYTEAKIRYERASRELTRILKKIKEE